MGEIAQKMALWVLQAYKRLISPLFPPACRYTPTCSEYAMEAIANYGVVRGAATAIWRLLRCHPLAKGGIDLPVKPAGHDTRINPGLCSH
jgi:putative membrane protein insertion efficiency factor